MGNKSSKNNKKQSKSSLKNETLKNNNNDNTETLKTPSKVYSELINESCSDGDYPPRPESPIKRLKKKIDERGFFGTIKRATIKKTKSIRRTLSNRRDTKPTLGQTQINDDFKTSKNSLLINSTQSTPLKTTFNVNRSLLVDNNKTYSDLDLSREVVVDEDKFNQTIETLIFDEEESKQKIDSARDIITDDINNTARELVIDILREAFDEVQNETENSVEKIDVCPKLNASLSEDQYSGQLSSRNNSPAKIRRLSENHQICDDSPLAKKQVKNDVDSDVETLENETLPQTLSTEILKKIADVQSSRTITPAVVPEKVDVHDISNWSLDDSARELVPRPSVRENLEDTTLEARKTEVVDKINQQQQMLQLLKEQYQAKTKIYEEIIKLSEDERLNGLVGENLECDSSVTNNSSSISGRQIRTSTTSTGTIKAPLTTIETYLPTEVSTESMAGELNDEIKNSTIPGVESNLSVSKTSQESGSSYNSKESDETIGRTMKKTEDRRSINMAKEKTVKEDTRVIASHTTQNEKSKKSTKAKKETTEGQIISECPIF